MKHKVSDRIMRIAAKNFAKQDLHLYHLKKSVDGVHEQRDIVYDEEYGMDFYTSVKRSSCNMYIVDIHGGAWIYGEKKLNRHFCMHMSSHGFPVFNIDYGLAPTFSVKMQIQQIFRVLHFIEAHKEAYGLENASMCLSGDSAGAHLATLVTCIIKDKKLQKIYEVDGSLFCVSALLLQHGIYNMEPFKKSKWVHFQVLYHWMFPKVDRKLRNKDSFVSILNEHWDVPIFLLSSKKDTMFSYQSEQLIKRLEYYKIPYTSLFWDETYKKLGHVFHITHPDYPESRESFQQMAGFLKNILKQENS